MKILVVSDCRFDAGALALNLVDHPEVLMLKQGYIRGDGKEVFLVSYTDVKEHDEAHLFDMVYVDCRIDLHNVLGALRGIDSWRYKRGKDVDRWRTLLPYLAGEAGDSV